MSETTVTAPTRWIGRYSTGRPGPTVLCCGGLHGNEPAGVLAAKNVIARLEQERPPLRGELLAVAGNLAALARGRRFVEVDLNRCWLDEQVRAVREQEPSEDRPEQAEQRALLEIIDEAAGSAEELVCMDLHTTSGDTPPFTLMSDTLRNRRLAFGLPLPILLGLEESVDGTLLEYLARRGHVAEVVEAGRHDDPRCVEIHEGALWMGLVAVGALRPSEVPEMARWRRSLSEAARGLPRVVEIRHHHKFAPGDGFVMKPSYRGFQEISKGEVLAHDRRGDILAPESGRMLMPHYQELGNDGFFIIRRVRRFWIALSGVVRRLRLGVVLPLLPGVRRHPTELDALLVDPGVARWSTVEIFHLFGYRRRRPEGKKLVFSRRRQR